MAALHVGQPEALDELLRRARLLVDLNRLPGAHHAQLRIALVQPGLGLGGVGLDHDHRVASARLGIARAERLGERAADAGPVLLRVRAEERDLGRSGRRRVAVDRDACAVGAAVAQLEEHVPQMAPEALADVERLREESCDSTHCEPPRATECK
jgi:hypothetical protein